MWPFSISRNGDLRRVQAEVLFEGIQKVYEKVDELLRKK